MAKNRKTRDQKKLADLRHNFTHSVIEQKVHLEAKIETQNVKITKPQYRPQALSSVNVYPYLIKDLSKTAVLTAAILGSQIILFILLKNHILTIPGLTY
jgi:hypothetical protein